MLLRVNVLFLRAYFLPFNISQLFLPFSGALLEFSLAALQEIDTISKPFVAKRSGSKCQIHSAFSTIVSRNLLNNTGDSGPAVT